MLRILLTLAVLTIGGCNESNPAMGDVHIPYAQHHVRRMAYTASQAINTIVGEAANQGLEGMTAVGEVIRHRGSLYGLYGFNAKHSYHEPYWVWIEARKAWYASAMTDYTHGADHFENIHAFGQPYWVKNCVQTFSYRDHVFYRERI